MRDKKKSEMNSKKLYDTDEAHTLTDIIIVFIGICILILAFLSLTGLVPKEYAVGATLAGFFFVFSDVVLIEEKIPLTNLVMYGVSLFLGVASFVLLPVILLMDARLSEFIMSNSDFITILALGIVLITIGIKTVLRKVKQQEKESNEINEIKEEQLRLIKSHGEATELIEKLTQDLADARLLVPKIKKDDE